MPRHATPIELTAAERTELERRVRARTSRQQDALRARIVLRAADGATNCAIAAELGVVRHTVQHWRDHFATDRLAGLADRPHQPAPRLSGPDIQAKIVVLACQKPADLGWPGQTHWTIQDLAQYIRAHPELGLGAPSKSTVHTILQAPALRLDRLWLLDGRARPGLCAQGRRDHRPPTPAAGRRADRLCGREDRHRRAHASGPQPTGGAGAARPA